MFVATWISDQLVIEDHKRVCFLWNWCGNFHCKAGYHGFEKWIRSNPRIWREILLRLSPASERWRSNLPEVERVHGSDLSILRQILHLVYRQLFNCVLFIRLSILGLSNLIVLKTFVSRFWLVFLPDIIQKMVALLGLFVWLLVALPFLWSRDVCATSIISAQVTEEQYLQSINCLFSFFSYYVSVYVSELDPYQSILI